MTKPKWALHLDDEGQTKIESAVAKAESRTSGEIVPMVVRSSSVRGHIFLTLILLLIVVISAIDMVAQQFVVLPLWFIFIEIVLVAVLGRALQSHTYLLRRFTPANDLTAQVEHRAQLEFWNQGLNKTDGSTGILLFVSLAEKRAVVLADKTIADKLPPETWQDVIGRLLGGIKAGDLSAGFCDAIEHCGEILAKHFPIRADDQNELPNKLILKE